MQKVLITGANGFLGVNLTKLLTDLGYEIYAMVRPGADITLLKAAACHIVYGHIDNEKDVCDAVYDKDIVIHTASVTGQFGIAYETYEKINVTATQYIAAACLQYKVRKMIHVSTANAIAPGSISRPGTELNGFSLFKANSGYINTKYLSQQYLLEMRAKHQLPVVIVNPTFMIGPNDAKPSSGQLVLYGLNKKILFYPPGGKNFVHIHDVCKGIINAIDKGKTGECYLLAGDNLSYGHFFKKLNSIAHQKPVMIKIPRTVLTIAGYMGSLIANITRKPVKLTRSSAFMLCLDNYYSGRKSIKELALQYQTTDTAIRDAYHWFDQNGMVRA